MQATLFDITQSALLTMNDAAIWASEHVGKDVTPANIAYLVQYGRVTRHVVNGVTLVDISELEQYYVQSSKREEDWRIKLGDDLNWALSFDKLKEVETTKHVHRLHPYKGKFIPQLVEYFLDEHVDTFKKEIYFHKGDIVLDPFSGSGTTMVQANELGMHAIGVDISAFNALMANCKVMQYDLLDLQSEIRSVTERLQQYVEKSNVLSFDEALTEKLAVFNAQYFPAPEYKYKIRRKLINESTYGEEKAKLFLPIFNNLVQQYNIKLLQPTQSTFLDKWYVQQIRNEIDFVWNEIKHIQNENTRKALTIILSRTIRSCRATTHADLGTLKEPIYTTYYCAKHGKICKPLFSTIKWWQTYCKDTLKRLQEFASIRTNTYQICLTGDSRIVDIFSEIQKQNPTFADMLCKQKIKGIFSSPPYVGMIDYHEQHAYSYELFGFKRNDDLEIGPLFKGKGKEAQRAYIDGIVKVLNNCKRFLVQDFDIFLVANDKYNLYPQIAYDANLEIVNQYKRPVLNRTEPDKGAYSEIIFHMKAKV